jgi:hypothetical protein
MSEEECSGYRLGDGTERLSVRYVKQMTALLPDEKHTNKNYFSNDTYW